MNRFRCPTARAVRERTSSQQAPRDDSHRPDQKTGSSCAQRRGSYPRGSEKARKSVGILKVARSLGIGTGTVQRISNELG
jgi:hypothetical protein